MVVIKKRKGKIILSAIMGALITGIIFGVFLFVYIQKAGLYPKELFRMKERLESSVLICLSCDTSEGEILTAEHLKEITVQVPQGNIKQQSLSDYEEKSLKISLGKGSILSPDMLCEGKKAADDERLLNLSYVKLNEKMKVGDYIDIRISFRNGGDYILLPKKKIQDITGNYADSQEIGQNALWLQVNEEEILRLASAVVDAYYQEGSEIYAIQYVSELQKAAEVTYPVNETVKRLLEADPNVTELAQGSIENHNRKELRSALEKEFDTEEGETRLDSMAENVINN